MSDSEVEDTPTIKQMRAQIEKVQQEAQANASRAEQAERHLAFAKAGLSLEDKKLGYFIKGYEGDITPEAIRTAATEAGFIETQQQAADPDIAALARMSEAPASRFEPPSREAEYQAALNAARSTAEVEEVTQRFGRGFTG